MPEFSRRALWGVVSTAGAIVARPQHSSQFDNAYRLLDGFIRQYLPEWNTPGLTLAITNAQELIHVRSYGFADATARSRVAAGTLFQIGSMSKAFAATAVLQLCERGKIALDSPLRRYLPWFRIRSKYPDFTIHHLLSHTAGIPANRDDLPSSLSQVSALSERETHSAPGTRFVYSNIGYEILGHVVAAVADEPYPEYLKKSIFQPLGMTKAAPAITNDLRGRLATGHPPYYDDRPPHSSHPSAPGMWVEWDCADGNIASDAADLARFLRMLINGGAHPAGRTLSAESYRLMTQGIVEIGNGRSYGYGISVRSANGRTILSHSGGMIGFSGIMLCDLHDGLGVVMLSNGAGKPGLVGEYALELLHACVARQRLPAPPISATKVTHAADYQGTYSSPNGKHLTIEAQGDQLWLEDGGSRVRLERRSEDTFYVNHPAYELFLLKFGRQDELVAELTSGSQWFAAKRYKGPRTFEYPSAWDVFPGHYRSYNPWLSNFRIVLRKGTLWFVHPDGGEAVLVPNGPAAFNVGEGGEQLRFDTVIDGLSQCANVTGAGYYRVRTP